MIRRPPKSPPFPYPTLFRSADADRPLARRDRVDRAAVEARLVRAQADDHQDREALEPVRDVGEPAQRWGVGPVRVVDDQDRSEEHTSELQSRQYLVCRLLLE